MQQSKTPRSCLRFIFHAYGHAAVSAIHPTTLEITKEGDLGRTGDCIVAVKSSIGLPDLPSAIKKALSTRNAQVRFVLRVHSRSVMIKGTGDIGLTLSHPTDIVVRKSGFTSDRTLMVKADKAAIDLPHAMVRLLQDPRNRVTIELSALTDGKQP